MDEIKKEIQRLKRKTMYLSVILISFVISMLFYCMHQEMEYARIYSKYSEVLEIEREITINLEELNPKIEEILSMIQ